MVASAYAPASRAFLAANTSRGMGVALDLGCGPAFSTQLLDEVSSPMDLVGLDSSPEFLEVARGRMPNVEFQTHDATSTPLPRAPADLIYARLLLAHVRDPLHTVGGWRSQLAPGGILLIEDLEGIVAPRGPLRAYDEVSESVVKRAGGIMCAGAVLARLGGECTPVTVPAATAARIYLFNVRRWIEDPASPTPEERLTELEIGLSALVERNVPWDGLLDRAADCDVRLTPSRETPRTSTRVRA